MLAAAFGGVVVAGHPVSLPGLLLDVVEDEPARSSGAADRLEMAAVDMRPLAVPLTDDQAPAGARLLALGWATVDADRAAAGWADARWTTAARDTLLGARALLGGPDAIVLLEPDTEGRLAAALARHGEGPATLYVGVPDGAAAGARARLAGLGVRVSAGPGPFGEGIAVMGTPPWSPTLILVPASASMFAGRSRPRRSRYHPGMTDGAALTFRDAGPDDAEWIAGLLSDEGYPAGATDIVRRLERYVERECPVRLAEAGGERAGFVACQVIPRFEHGDAIVRVMALVVDPGMRGRGVGRGLMAEAETIADAVDAAFIEVTAGHHRSGARRLFEALGYDASLTTYLRKRR
jgi:GNAT superfamily N-acetyltransferase